MAMFAAGVSTPAGLARTCNISRQTAVNWLAMREPDMKGTYLLKLAHCLSVRMRWLSEGKGPMAMSPVLDELAELSTHMSPAQLEAWLEAGRKLIA
jgi:hypothetical protein